MQHPFEPTVIYSVSELRELFTEVRDSCVHTLRREPEKGLSKPCEAGFQAKNAIASLTFLTQFNDSNYVGLSAVPAELIRPASETATPFYKSYVLNNLVVLNEGQAQTHMAKVQASADAQFIEAQQKATTPQP